MPESDISSPPTAETAPAAVTVDPRALWRAFLRPGRSQTIVAVLLCLVVATTLWTVRSHATDRTYAGMRRADLVTLLDTLNADSARLQDRIAELERTQEELQNGADRQQAADREATRRADTLAVLAGTAPAGGPGIRLVITDPQGRVGASQIVDALAELRDAGAEVIELNDAIRIVGTSAVTGAPGRLAVDGHDLSFPLTIEAIGDPHALSEGASFRGGLVSRIQSAEVAGQVTITELERIDVDSVVAAPAPAFARPR